MLLTIPTRDCSRGKGGAGPRWVHNALYSVGFQEIGFEGLKANVIKRLKEDGNKSKKKD